MNIWLESLDRNFNAALDLLASALSDCSEERWQASMWVVDEADELSQRKSTPWGVAWHALEVLDYDLNGEFGPWSPPAPFAGIGHWQITKLPAAWSRPELLGYLEYCRGRVRETLAGMTDERAATPLPPAHRYGGQPHAWVVTSLVGHTIEHGSQIRQFNNDQAPKKSTS